ncbi:tetratricopeptide repeat protein [Undibacterium sp. TJN19]|uniref:tetratricopeptide repeat protein n=1 Tax=Undibacterium sp. TJN19 TaxID=3413055 RepID=UPI003BF1127D
MSTSSYAPAEKKEVEELWYILEEHQPFAKSLLWQMQRHYFNQRGANAWRHEEVPHYVTSNPTIAQAYAETVFAFYQDRQNNQVTQAHAEVLTLCELGAGSGRFAFYFLRHLMTLCTEYNVPPSAFLYVLTDFTQTNLDAWCKHASFQDWFAIGLLDVALFDVNDGDQLNLQISDKRIGKATLQNPIVVLANYVFDGVPQDLLYFKDGIAHHTLVSLASAEKPDELDTAALLAQLQVHSEYQICEQPFYAEPALQAQLEQYCHHIDAPDGAHILFPATSLRCLNRLQALSTAGMMLLSADKGNCQLAGVVHADAPGLILHGSFSLSVNYHAFIAWCEASGGLALQPLHHHQSVAIICLLLVDNPDVHIGTRRAYQQQIGNFGPDDFYTISKCLNQQKAAMGADAIFSYMRFNRNDAHQLMRLIPRLAELIPDLDETGISTLKQLLHACWQAYFPLGEERDLAFDMAGLFYAMNDFPAALHYFKRTQDIYGRHTGTLFNMAACHEQMGEYEQARSLLEKLLEVAPENEAASVLLAQLSV